MSAIYEEWSSILHAKFRQDGWLKHVSFSDLIIDFFRFSRIYKNAIKRRMQIEKKGTLYIVRIDGKTFYWPQEALLDTIAFMYYEVYFKGNNHYYDPGKMAVKKGDVVFDCGACEGFFTRKALDAGADKVYCIEPVPALIKCLEMTFAAEIISGRVVLWPYIIGNKNKVVKYYKDLIKPEESRIVNPDEVGSDSLLAAETDMFSIDALCDRYSIRKIDFIKVDVEGAEVALVQGAEKTIKTLKPSLAVAVYHNPENGNLIFEYLKALTAGYKISVTGITRMGNPIGEKRIPRPVMVRCFQNSK
jgi:FkbM family methyltransferase